MHKYTNTQKTTRSLTFHFSKKKTLSLSLIKRFSVFQELYLLSYSSQTRVKWNIWLPVHISARSLRTRDDMNRNSRIFLYRKKKKWDIEKRWSKKGEARWSDHKRDVGIHTVRRETEETLNRNHWTSSALNFLYTARM